MTRKELMNCLNKYNLEDIIEVQVDYVDGDDCSHSFTTLHLDVDTESKIPLLKIRYDYSEDYALCCQRELVKDLESKLLEAKIGLKNLIKENLNDYS